MSKLTAKGNDADNGYVNVSADGKGNGYGVGGISGIKHPEWTGFEQTTVGVASNVLNRINTQNGIQSTDPMISSAREPFRVGRFLVKWVKAPPFFPEIAVKYLRWIFEDMVMEVSGVPENSIDRIDITNGATRQTSSYPGIYKESGNEVTLKVRECAGSPVRKFLDWWISGISDRKTGVCHMYGRKMRGIQANISGTILYVLLGPTCRPEDIEFACMWAEIVPYQEKTSHLNSGAIGEAGSGVDMDVTFAGTYDRGPEIDIYARKVVEGYNLYGQTFLNQLLPSFMYDPDMYAATDYKNTNTIDINDRLRNIAETSDSADIIYNDGILNIRNTQFRNGASDAVPYLAVKTTAQSFGEMGVIESGFSKNLETVTTDE